MDKLNRKNLGLRSIGKLAGKANPMSLLKGGNPLSKISGALGSNLLGGVLGGKNQNDAPN